MIPVAYVFAKHEGFGSNGVKSPVACFLSVLHCQEREHWCTMSSHSLSPGKFISLFKKKKLKKGNLYVRALT